MLFNSFNIIYRAIAQYASIGSIFDSANNVFQSQKPSLAFGTVTMQDLSNEIKLYCAGIEKLFILKRRSRAIEMLGLSELQPAANKYVKLLNLELEERAANPSNLELDTIVFDSRFKGRSEYILNEAARTAAIERAEILLEEYNVLYDERYGKPVLDADSVINVPRVADPSISINEPGVCLTTMLAQRHKRRRMMQMDVPSRTGGDNDSMSPIEKLSLERKAAWDKYLLTQPLGDDGSGTLVSKLDFDVLANLKHIYETDEASRPRVMVQARHLSAASGSMCVENVFSNCSENDRGYLVENLERVVLISTNQQWLPRIPDTQLRVMSYNDTTKEAKILSEGDNVKGKKRKITQLL